jgi:hypothetical protein
MDISKTTFKDGVRSWFVQNAKKKWAEKTHKEDQKMTTIMIKIKKMSGQTNSINVTVEGDWDSVKAFLDDIEYHNQWQYMIVRDK